jgi:hypothetical protein
LALKSFCNKKENAVAKKALTNNKSKHQKNPATATKPLNKTKTKPIAQGGGVSEPGLNRWPDKNKLHLRYGGGLKILWRRPSWVQVPPPPPTC